MTFPLATGAGLARTRWKAQSAALDIVAYSEAMTMFVAAKTGELAKVRQFTKRVAGADLNVAIGLARLSRWWAG